MTTPDSEADVQSLIEKTEKEGDQTEATGQNQPEAFSFAKIWASDKDALTEMNDADSEHANEAGDSWAQVLAKLEAERGKTREQEVTGRGAKRKAAPSFSQKVSVSFPMALVVGSWMSQQTHDVPIGSDGSSAENSPEKPKKKKGKKLLDREEYSVSAPSSDAESEGGSSVAPDDLMVDVVKKTKRGVTFAPVYGYVDTLNENYCGLCGTIHVDTCHMVQNPDNLAEYRAMLIEVTNEESIETRVSCLALESSASGLTSYTARCNPGHR